MLTEKKWQQFGPDNGLQACGETGPGRMLEVNDILAQLESCFSTGELQGVNVMVTAGPTYEAIDPVRYIGNRSSGRMGYAVARAAQEAGARVILISGPVQLTPPERISVVKVESASEMQQAVLANLSECDIYISAAAVSDYRVANVASQKIKKTSDTLMLPLVKNTDIIAEVAAQQNGPYVVGFAAETENLVANARDKLVRKNLDMIVANDVSTPAEGGVAIGFNSEYNALHVFWQDTEDHCIREQAFAIAGKSLLAKQLITLIAQQYNSKHKPHAQNTA
jgi:phosphopantothenoylcysteine decarboxylase/phosphopantothenate--cysteine ligase